MKKLHNVNSFIISICNYITKQNLNYKASHLFFCDIDCQVIFTDIFSKHSDDYMSVGLIPFVPEKKSQKWN